MSETMDSSTQTCDEPEFGSGARGFASPRVQIDTSAPFGSVEEAVIRFGGRGYWIPRDIFHSAPSSDESEEVDICKLEEQAAQMLNDLDTKQQETLGILKELELTKRFIEELKLKLHKESSGFHIQAKKDTANDNQTNSVFDSPNFFPLSPAGLVMLELKQAKQNLSQSTNDLESIRASVEHVNKKMEKKKIPLKKESLHTEIPNPLGISRELRELNNEAEQFMKTAEAAKAEVLKAMSEIEQTKTGLKMIEMRWVAAKKLEEAAKATEALALAEIKALSSNETVSQQKSSRISLSLEEYYALAEKARKAENLEGTTVPRRLNRNDVPQFRNFFWSQRRRDEMLQNPNETRHGNAERKDVQRPTTTSTTTSIGDILSRKLVMRDDLDIGRQGEERVSLNQMLDRHRSGTPPPRRRTEKNNGASGPGSGGDSKSFFWKRKGFGFVHVSLPLSKQSKNRIQSLNLW